MAGRMFPSAFVISHSDICGLRLPVRRVFDDNGTNLSKYGSEWRVQPTHCLYEAGGADFCNPVAQIFLAASQHGEHAGGASSFNRETVEPMVPGSDAGRCGAV